MYARRPFRDFVFSVKSANDGLRYYTVSGKPDFGDDWAFRGYKGTSSNVTEREELKRLKQDFIATVSNELQMPLTSMKGALGLVLGGVTGSLPEDSRKLIGIAEKNSEHLVNLVNDILDVEKLQSGKMDYSFETADLAALARNAIEANQHYGEEYDITCALSCAPAAAEVQAAPHLMDQVFAKLLSNAVKFSPKGGKVDSRIEKSGTGWQVSVTDKGPASLTGIAIAFSNVSVRLVRTRSTTRRVPGWASVSSGPSSPITAARSISNPMWEKERRSSLIYRNAARTTIVVWKRTR